MDDDAERVLAGRGFAELSHELARELTPRGVRRRYEKGRFVYRRGDPPEGAYIVLGGSVRISALGSDGDELVLTDLSPGSFFGEVSVFDGLPRTHDAYALERSELLFVEGAALEALLETRPEIARHLLRTLALKVRISLAALDGVALGSVSARLALRLLVLARGGGGGAPAMVSASQSDLARMVGSTRQSINRELKAWEREGVIRLEGRAIVIADDAALRRRAHL